ncbi:MAG TPA: lycopene cyclase domain-containing protein [Candidatus Saccharimonadales bacterium]|jgi:lycopene cyclase domain-containing protein
MLEQYAYLAALLVSISGLLTLDHRFRLAVFYDRKRTLATIGLSVAVFIVWDVFGVINRIFRVGETTYLTGLRIGAEFPIEELFFLTLLTYSALLLYRGGEQLWQRT